MNTTERVIEVPWALSVYEGEERVLEIGYAHAELNYISGLVGLQCKELHGIDLAYQDIDGMIKKRGDIRDTDFPDDYFDLIFCISTIEHIGRINSIYFESDDPVEDGDFEAAKEMKRILKKKGKLVLTVPYGKAMNYGWFIHYNEERWKELKERLGLHLIREDFFHYNQGWFDCDPKVLANTLYRDNGAPAASGLVCALFLK